MINKAALIGIMVAVVPIVASAQAQDSGSAHSGYPSYCPTLSQTLQRGARDSATNPKGQVTELQKFLSGYYDIDPAGIVTGFFGARTFGYVVEFQKEKKLPSYGIVGSMTRAAIAAVCKGESTLPEFSFDNTDVPSEQGSGASIPGSYIVTLKKRPSSTSVSDFTAGDNATGHTIATTHRYSKTINGFAADLTESDVAVLKQDEDVESIVPDRTVTVFDTQSVPTGIRRINAQALSQKGAGVNVAILDTGIDQTHPDLAGNIAGGVDCTGNGTWSDAHGHGTHVAGTIAANDNGFGVVGVAPQAKLWSVRVLGPSGSGAWSQVICGLDYVAANAPANGGPITLVNMSLGGSGVSDNACGSLNQDPLHAAICRARDAGVTIVVAAGNSSKNADQFVPAAYNDAVITVSALVDSDGEPGYMGGSNDDVFAGFSNYGSVVDIGAPGVGILSTVPTSVPAGFCALCHSSGYRLLNGTSMAAPHVAGAAAHFLEKAPRALWTEVLAALKAGAEKYGSVTHRDYDELSHPHPEPIVIASKTPGPGTPGSVSLSFSRLQYMAGEGVSVSWGGATEPNPADWITFIKAGEPYGTGISGAAGTFAFTGGTASGTVPLAAPAEAGTYQLVYFRAGNTGFDDLKELGRSERILVTASVFFDASSLTATSSKPTIRGGAANTDALAIVIGTAPNYLWGSPFVTVANGTWSITIGTELPNGTYDITAVNRAGKILAKGKLTLNASATLVLSDKLTYTSGQSVKVSWYYAQSPNPNDWIGFVKAGQPYSTGILGTPGTFKLTNGTANGELALTAPGPGTYQLAYFRAGNTGFDDLKESGRSSAINVVAPASGTITFNNLTATSPTPTLAGGAYDVPGKFAIVIGTAPNYLWGSEWIIPTGSYTSWQVTVGKSLSNGTYDIAAVDASGAIIAKQTLKVAIDYFTVTTDKTYYKGGELIQVNWLNVSSPKQGDVILLAPEGKTNSEYDGSQGPAYVLTDGAAVGTKSFTAPNFNGTYEMIYYTHDANNTALEMGRSRAFVLSPVQQTATSSVDITANGARDMLSLAAGQNLTVAWTSSNMTSCTLSAVSKEGTINGTATVAANTPGMSARTHDREITFTISCTNAQGQVFTKAVVATVATAALGDSKTQLANALFALESALKAMLQLLGQ